MRLMLGMLGVITTLFPDRVIDVFEAIAISDAGNASTRPWFRSSIRAEGVLITIACLFGGRLYGAMMNVTGVFGAVVLLSPDVYRKIATAIVYDQPGQVKWNEQFTSVVRVIGVLYVWVAIRAFKRRRATLAHSSEQK